MYLHSQLRCGLRAPKMQRPGQNINPRRLPRRLIQRLILPVN